MNDIEKPRQIKPKCTVLRSQHAATNMTNRRTTVAPQDTTMTPAPMLTPRRLVTGNIQHTEQSVRACMSSKHVNDRPPLPPSLISSRHPVNSILSPKPKVNVAHYHSCQLKGIAIGVNSYAHQRGRKCTLIIKQSQDSPMSVSSFTPKSSPDFFVSPTDLPLSSRTFLWPPAFLCVFGLALPSPSRAPGVQHVYEYIF